MSRLRALALLAVVLLAAAVPALAGRAENPPLQLVVAEDRFYKDDFNARAVDQNNVDWPISLLFFGNASVNKVKTLLFNPYPWPGSAEYALLSDDGTTYAWDADLGQKTALCPGFPLQPTSARHYRVYADAPLGQDGGLPGGDDRLYNLYWGYRVFGSAHWDVNECNPFAPRWFGLSESAEDWLVVDWANKGYPYVQDWASFSNREPFEVQGDHVYDNDGYASAFLVG